MSRYDDLIAKLTKFILPAGRQMLLQREAVDVIRTLSKERDMALEALREMTEVCERDFTNEITETEAPDEDSVQGLGNNKLSALTFGHIRRARDTLAQLEASKGEG